MICGSIPALLRRRAHAVPVRWWPDLVTFGFGLALSLTAHGATSQPPKDPPVNPRTIEFDIAAGGQAAEIVGFRVELFPRGADTATGSPVSTLHVPRPRGRQAGLVVDLRELLAGVPDGEYVATVRSIGRGGESARSAPTDPFVVSGQADVPKTTPATGPESPRTPAAAPDPDPAREPRVWTFVGIAMGAAAFLLGFLFR